jgi:hypothetical protein
MLPELREYLHSAKVSEVDSQDWVFHFCRVALHAVSAEDSQG